MYVLYVRTEPFATLARSFYPEPGMVLPRDGYGSLHRKKIGISVQKNEYYIDELVHLCHEALRGLVTVEHENGAVFTALF